MVDNRSSLAVRQAAENDAADDEATSSGLRRRSRRQMHVLEMVPPEEPTTDVHYRGAHHRNVSRSMSNASDQDALLIRDSLSIHEGLPEQAADARATLSGRARTKDKHSHVILPGDDEFETIELPDRASSGDVGNFYAHDDEDDDTAEDAPLIHLPSAYTRRSGTPGSSLLVPETFDDKVESGGMIFLQILFPFLIAGFGMVGAGLVLDIVQHWEVYTSISELFIVVPALLGLKGNLEMTLASRLSTASNTGKLSGKNAWSIIGANLALVQCQAVVVGSLSALFAVVVGAVKYGRFSLSHALLIGGASCATASIASLVLGIVMAGVIVACARFHVNPDNIATPIAAALGDVTTLTVLSTISVFFYRYLHTDYWLVGPIFALGVVWVALPLSIHYSWQSDSTRSVLIHGWTPVIAAMLISSGAGAILEKVLATESTQYFQGVAVFQPVINGVAGNLVAVQASRIGTYLHKYYRVPGNTGSAFNVLISPIEVFFPSQRSGDERVHAVSARVLLALVIPGHLIFTYAIVILDAGHTSVTPRFVAIYLSAALLQVALLLVVTHILTFYLWSIGQDPDTTAIPYLTALGDLTGTAFLTLAFYILYLIGDRDTDVGD